VLTRPSATVSGGAAIAPIGNGWGEMRYREQKFGGIGGGMTREQAIAKLA
jgi:hypothetical protein